ncbi:hypothetical protein HZB01_01585 [Candidatus Woesearchaeota archaeon]|nr:hypothetical protein [Candidatus Woesearchaeota archaeon]
MMRGWKSWIALMMAMLVVTIPFTFADALRTVQNPVRYVPPDGLQWKTAELKTPLAGISGQDSDLGVTLGPGKYKPDNACDVSLKKRLETANKAAGTSKSLEIIAAINYAFGAILLLVNSVISVISIVIGYPIDGSCKGQPYTSAICAANFGWINAWDTFYKPAKLISVDLMGEGWCGLAKNALGSPTSGSAGGQVAATSLAGISPYSSIYIASLCLSFTGIMYNLYKLRAVYSMDACCRSEACNAGVSPSICDNMYCRSSCTYWRGAFYGMFMGIIVSLIARGLAFLFAKIVSEKAAMKIGPTLGVLLSLVQAGFAAMTLQAAIKWIEDAKRMDSASQCGDYKDKFQKMMSDAKMTNYWNFYDPSYASWANANNGWNWGRMWSFGTKGSKGKSPTHNPITVNGPPSNTPAGHTYSMTPKGNINPFGGAAAGTSGGNPLVWTWNEKGYATASIDGKPVYYTFGGKDIPAEFNIGGEKPNTGITWTASRDAATGTLVYTNKGGLGNLKFSFPPQGNPTLTYQDSGGNVVVLTSSDGGKTWQDANGGAATLSGAAADFNNAQQKIKEDGGIPFNNPWTVEMVQGQMYQAFAIILNMIIGSKVQDEIERHCEGVCKSSVVPPPPSAAGTPCADDNRTSYDGQFITQEKETVGGGWFKYSYSGSIQHCNITQGVENLGGRSTYAINYTYFLASLPNPASNNPSARSAPVALGILSFTNSTSFANTSVRMQGNFNAICATIGTSNGTQTTCFHPPVCESWTAFDPAENDCLCGPTNSCNATQYCCGSTCSTLPCNLPLCQVNATVSAESCNCGNTVCDPGSSCCSDTCQASACPPPPAPPSCTDTVKNLDETDVDCGGSCLDCADGKACAANTDCLSAVCENSVCKTVQCIPGNVTTCTDLSGLCQQATKTCSNTGTWEPCSPFTAIPGYEATETKCDAKDNDCNGETDENIAPKLCDKQLGVCVDKTVSCTSGAFPVCTATEYGSDYQTTETTCDGKDNDCDGTVDEGCTCVGGITRPCTTQKGVCKNGIQLCTAGAWGDCDYSAVPDYEPDAEVSCDHKDNNCDGLADETFDQDGDGFTVACPDGRGTFTPSGQRAIPDCDDADATKYPTHGC